MKLYFTRHGKTEWNEQQRFQGMLGDSPLLPESYKEIEKLGKYIKDVPFAKVYASSSKRAQDTAKGIAAQLTHPVEIIATDALRELGLGRLEGAHFDEGNDLYGDTIKQLRYHLDQYDPTPFDGEPIQEALDRVTITVKEAVARHDGPVLFVGHGASLTAAIQWLAGNGLGNLRDKGGLTNSSLSILETPAEDGLPYQLIKWNDTSFLK